MLIVNPIYDQAFKYMMDNEEVAKRVVSIIIEKKVLKIQPRPQEVKLMYKKTNIPLSRFDFKAVIEDETGEAITVLIEIQKSNKPDPIIRFRRYLGKNYIRTETIINKQGEEEEVVLPISTIYILGYNLDEYETPGLLVNNQVTDAVTKKPIAHKNDFVKLLTHPSYILQTNRLRPERRTKLEKFLAIFDQNKTTDDKYLLNYDEDDPDPDISLITKYLNRGTLDEELLNQLELEEDMDKEFDKMEDALNQARKEKAEAQQKIIDLVKMLKSMNVPTEQISEKTGLSAEEIEKL